MIKSHGGVLCPADDVNAEKMKRFPTGEQFEIDIKLSRNPAFHRKVFAFFNYCFGHWLHENDCISEGRQFDIFREHLTVLAGFYESYTNIKGEVRIEAKSLSFGSMDQEEFEECYIALTNAAMKHIFQSSDETTLNRLMSFF